MYRLNPVRDMVVGETRESPSMAGTVWIGLLIYEVKGFVLPFAGLSGISVTVHTMESSFTVEG